jgi:hypothetical protein
VTAGLDRRAASWGLAALAAGLLVSGVAAAEERFETRLAPVAMDLLTRDSVAGVGRAQAVLNGNRLVVSATFEGLPSRAVSANLRQGIAIGARGPVAFNLDVSGGTSGTLSGSMRLNRAQTAALKEGRMYVQIQSEGAPDGHLWGWLLPPRRDTTAK